MSIGASKNKGSSTTNSSSTSTSTLAQDAQLKNLLAGADSWLASGGLGDQQTVLPQMGQLMQAQGQQYMDMMSGKGQADRYAALQNAQKASADIAAGALDKSMAGIQSAASAAGQGGSSRQGLAQGVAAGEAQAQLAAQQAAQNQQYLNTENALKQAGAAGLGNLWNQAGQYNELIGQESEGAKQLQNLLAYQGLISGNMGGSTTTSGTSTSDSSSSKGGFEFSDPKLKKKIKKVKTKNGKQVKTKDGIDVNEWEWNDDAEKELGLSGKGVGVLSSDVKKKKKKAVKKDPSTGYEKVNYGSLM